MTDDDLVRLEEHARRLGLDREDLVLATGIHPDHADGRTALEILAFLLEDGDDADELMELLDAYAYA